MRAGVDPGVRDARREGGQRGAEGRPHETGAEGERHGRGGVSRGHGGTGGLGMDKPEDRKVLGQRAGPRQQCLEPEVRDRGSDGLRQHAVQGGAARPAGKEGHHGGDAKPELALVRRSGKPPEEVVMSAPGEAGHGAYEFPVKFPQPARRFPQHAAHSTTLLPDRDGTRSDREGLPRVLRQQPPAACLVGAQGLRGAGEQKRTQDRDHDGQQGQPDSDQVTKVAQQRRAGQERDVPDRGDH